MTAKEWPLLTDSTEQYTIAELYYTSIRGTKMILEEGHIATLMYKSLIEGRNIAQNKFRYGM